jgi:hypothetical protein
MTAKAAYHIPLTDDELKMLGEICAIQGQIEYLIAHTISMAINLNPKATNAILDRNTLSGNADIWREVIRARAGQQSTRDAADEAFKEIVALTEGRNDFVHAFFAKEVKVDLFGKGEPSTGILLSPGPDSNPGTVVGIRTRGGKKRPAAEIKSVRDRAAELSVKVKKIDDEMWKTRIPQRRPPRLG